jgi:hypothetical protein
VKQTVGYTFYWFDGATTGAIGSEIATGPVLSPKPNATYSVFARHNTFNCGSNPKVVTIGLTTRSIVAAVTPVHDFTNCMAPDGKLIAIPANSQPVADFTFQWFEGTVFNTSPVLSNSSELSNVKAGTYSVLIRETSTNCQTVQSGTILDNTVKPIVSADSTRTNCNPNNTGTATANVGGATNGFVFSWYNGSTQNLPLTLPVILTLH